MTVTAIITVKEQITQYGDCFPRRLSKIFPGTASLQDVADWVGSVTGGPERRDLLSGPEIFFEDTPHATHIQTSKETAICNAPEKDNPFDFGDDIPF